MKGAVALGGNVKVKDGKASRLGRRRARREIRRRARGQEQHVDRDRRRPRPRREIETPANIDLSRTSSKVTLDQRARHTVVARRAKLIDLARLIVAAEAVGICRETTNMAAEYAKVRVQFGRVIAMYQGVKHHCANMSVATELSTAAVWDAAIQSTGRRRRVQPRRRCRRRSRAALLRPVRQPQPAGARRHRLYVGARRPPLHAPRHRAAGDRRRQRRAGRRGRPHPQGREARPQGRPRREGRGDPQGSAAFVDKVKGLQGDAQRDALVDSGYAVPNWPKPYGRAGGRRRAARHRRGVPQGRHHASRSTASPPGTSSRSSSTATKTRCVAGSCRR